ncbi:hypothetical protein LCGC14_0460930 [marine sediment metagenome]|uniref:PD-(D/E)XK endonuclease-like domain-containing protein n=1 Tax=marine sediment metagenome TaxID=412755 RepID=A0A0F9V1W9_9ZZZZ|nr:hypothetical protein [bacterium]
MSKVDARITHTRVTPRRILPKHKEHTPYFNEAGVRVPSVTTILERQCGWSKLALCGWNNKMGLKGVDTKKYLSDKGQIGTLAHAFCTDYLLQQHTDMADYSPSQVEEAKHSFYAFHNWTKLHTIRPILLEAPLVSEIYQYGGQCDIYGEVDGLLELSDLKSGSGVYEDMIVQVSAYKQLLEEHGHAVNRVRIINIPRSEDETFLDPIVTNLMPEAFEAFKRFRENHISLNKIRRMRGRG